MSDLDQRHVLTDVDIPFGRLIVLLIQIGLASIPAAIIVSLALSLVFALLGLLFGGLGWMGPGMMGR